MANTYRRIVLSLTGNPLVSGFVQRYGMKMGAARFVAGSNLKEALDSVEALNRQGIGATLDHLGEFVGSAAEAETAAAECVAVLDGIAQRKVDCNLSVKLTQLGLDLDRELCLKNVRRIIGHAKEHGNFVRIDMEDSPRTDATLDIFKSVRADYSNTGTVLQSYMRRSLKDQQELQAMGTNLRLVKGAYLEPPEVAYQDKAEVDDNYVRMMESQLLSKCHAAIATHDEAIIAKALEYIGRNQIPRDRYEFQMLYGIRTDLQRKLASEGHRVRVYVPFGRDWYGYFTRRLAERPENIWFVLKNLLKG